MFCGCRNAFGAPPNSNVCPVCLGLPGSLPVPNEKAIESIVRIGLALGLDDRARTRCSTGRTTSIRTCRRTTRSASTTCRCASAGVSRSRSTASRRPIGITRVHMEEDTGKTTHVGAGGRIGQAEYALVDYNRAGVPLVECVSEPDMRSAEQARAYFTELRATLEALERLGRSDGGGVAPVRREHLHPARRRDRARHQGRDQEPQLGPLARTRAAVRGGAAAGRARTRRAARPGDAPLRRGDRRDAHAAFEGGGVRLPLLPRARPAAARTRPRRGSKGFEATLPSCPAALREPVRRAARV